MTTIYRHDIADRYRVGTVFVDARGMQVLKLYGNVWAACTPIRPMLPTQLLAQPLLTTQLKLPLTLRVAPKEIVQ